MGSRLPNSPLSTEERGDGITTATEAGPCGPESEVEEAAPELRTAAQRVSGLYTYSAKTSAPSAALQEASLAAGEEDDGAGAAEREAFVPPVSAKLVLRESLRLDVDGRYPQMAASGTIYQFLTERTHWVAKLRRNADGSYGGPIWYKDGDVSTFPYTTVRITTVRSLFTHQRSAKVTFSGGGTGRRVRTYRFESTYFRPCEFEYDTVEGTEKVTSIKTHDHATRPATLPSETLSIEQVFQRAGFNVTKSGGDAKIPLRKAGTDEVWTNAEMHDAMQHFWSKFGNRAQWSVWTLFAALHEDGESLGGIMFDDIGPNHRQGTAVFNESFIKKPPPADTQRGAWIKRMRFWTAVHEMGHTFNLAHSWQKAHPPAWGTPWTSLTNEPEARSFMNYPYYVSGGQSAFFETFEYRFSDQELLFMRHAPERFVQHGNAEWFDHHGFEQTRRVASPRFRLELRVNRDPSRGATPTFQFLEPVVIELKLTNVSGEPQLVEERLLATAERRTVAVKREGRPARQHAPYAQYCWHARKQVLNPGQALYESLFVGAGMNGWDVAEPGRYVIQVALHLDDEDVVSNALQLRVSPPHGFDEEDLAQDFFTEDVGRALAFDGTQELRSANDVLRRATKEFSKHPVALHAGVALGSPLARNFKALQIDMSAPPPERLRFTGQGVKMEEATEQLTRALTDAPVEAAKSLGHIDYAYYTQRFGVCLAQQGDTKHAQAVREQLGDTLAERGVQEPIRQQVDSRVARAIETVVEGKTHQEPDTRRPRRKGGVEGPSPEAGGKR